MTVAPPVPGVTLFQHLLPQDTHLAALMLQVGVAAKRIADRLGQAGIREGVLGFTGETNVQGERVRPLDQYANDVFIEVLKDTGLVSLLVSEELEEPFVLSQTAPAATHALVIDPVDGSSNIDVNVSVASIFSVQPLGDGRSTSPLQPGSAQTLAGYVLYGPNTVLVYTSGHGVHGFTLDRTLGEFVLTHPNLQMPERGEYYSLNDAYSATWTPGVIEFIDYLKSAPSRGEKGYSARYIGSLAADFHRTLLTGGVFLYPGTTSKPGGKLRLLYEAQPLAFIAEQAGGRATDGHRRILDIEPARIHERTPLVIGSTYEVELASAFARGEYPAP